MLRGNGLSKSIPQSNTRTFRNRRTGTKSGVGRARLRYPDIYGYPDHVQFAMRDGSPFPGYWTMDYPRSDRHLLAGIRRLTRIDTRSVEQVVTLDGTDDVYNWPVLYGLRWGIGIWAMRKRNNCGIICCGRFFMCDDFHGQNLTAA